MKATMFKDYGNYEKVYVDEIVMPKVTSDSVIVRIHSSSINMMDIRVLTGTPVQIRQMLGNPSRTNNILGSDISGVIEEIGSNVKDFSVGDEVFGQLALNQGGGFAEFALIPATQLALKPKNVSHSEASTIPLAGLTALQALRKINTKEGTNVLIYGASGGVGTFAIQIAKALGANVTAVCSTRNISNAIESNADTVIDYKKDEWYDLNKKYDAIFAVNGYNPVKMYVDSLVDNGKCLIIGSFDSMHKIEEEKNVLSSYIKSAGKEVIQFVAQIDADDYRFLSSLVENKKLKLVVDREFPITDVQNAVKYFMDGRTIGKTVIKVIE